MLQAVSDVAADRTVRCLIITGGLPDIFIRHYDVAELVGLGEALAERPLPPPTAAPPAGGYLALVDRIAALPIPVIAAINGLCMGGGFELALNCDLRIAGRSVTAIGLPETRIGLFPGGGGTQRLVRLVGEARALEMILRGRVVDGEKAAELGLVHEAVADPVERALEIAAEFAARPAEGLAYAKHLIRAALDRPLSEGLAAERRAFLEVVRLPSAIQAMASSLTDAPLGTREPS
nr:enoyl-CoA hydratase/isomerase family protein [Caulobacter sp. S6]